MSEVTLSHNVYSSNNVTGGDDYDSGPYNVTFPAGVTSVSFNVPIIDDDVLEENENFKLVIGNSLPRRTSGRRKRGQATVTILNTDSKLHVYDNWHLH